MKIPTLFISILLIPAFLSCRKDDIEIPATSTTPLITRVKSADQPVNEYIYDGKNLVSTEKGIYNFITHSYNDLTQLVTSDYYSAEGMLSKDQQALEIALNRKGLLNFADSKIGATLKFEYNSSGQLVTTRYTPVAGTGREHSEFSYDINDRIARQKLFWDKKATGYIDFMYDGRGNLISEKVYSISSSGVEELNTTTHYEFDNYKNPYRSFYKLVTPGINTNPNNIIKETSIIHFKPGEGTDIVQVTTTAYTYNSKGYPVRKGTLDYVYE
jgi:hypothetical protein